MAVRKSVVQKAPKFKSNTTTVALYNLAQKKKQQRQSGNTTDTRGAKKGMSYYLGEMKKNTKIKVAANKEKIAKESANQPTTKVKRTVKPAYNKYKKK